jgi:hypothetical protein
MADDDQLRHWISLYGSKDIGELRRMTTEERADYTEECLNIIEEILERKESEERAKRDASDGDVRVEDGSVPAPASKQDNPLFLHIPLSRLILMSIVSVGVYEFYWIYKNWRYAKERDNLDISPFWRGWFGIFYCHSLLRRIHEDKEACSVQLPSFSPGSLATGWVVLRIISYVVGRAPGIATGIIAAFIPSFLCLFPIQNYVNCVSEQRSPGQPYYRWSSGHVVCLVSGILIWALLGFQAINRGEVDATGGQVPRQSPSTSPARTLAGEETANTNDASLARTNQRKSSFPNEPHGYRSVKFRSSPGEVLKAFPGATRVETGNTTRLKWWAVSGEKVWDWENATVRFVFYRDLLYAVAIDYGEIVTGPDLDAKASENATDRLILARATETYGTPETVPSPDGKTLYLWRGVQGTVSLDQSNKILSLTDSQLLIEYQSEASALKP